MERHLIQAGSNSNSIPEGGKHAQGLFVNSECSAFRNGKAYHKNSSMSMMLSLTGQLEHRFLWEALFSITTVCVLCIILCISSVC